MPYAHPQFLVNTDWLASHLDDPSILVYDCTTHLIPQNDPALAGPYQVQSGLEDYRHGHIPGAAFIDLQGDLSDSVSPLRFTCPDSGQLLTEFSSLGIGNDSLVVLYSQTTPQWATRVWWMLRTIGFDNARVLDGGMTKWKLEGRAVDTVPTTHPSVHLTTVPRRGLMVSKKEVLESIGNPAVCTINALRRVQHAGHDSGDFGNYGRPGHIRGSINVPTAELVDEVTTAFLPADRIAAIFAASGARDADRVLTYCGGGIAASATAMLLIMLGFDNVGLYDASLSEWAPDDTLPMDTLPTVADN